MEIFIPNYKKDDDNHAFQISGSDHYICRKCMKILSKKKKCECGASFEKQLSPVLLEKSTRDIYYAQYLNGIWLNIDKESQKIKMASDIVNIAGKAGGFAAKRHKHKTLIFDMKNKIVLWKSRYGVKNVTLANTSIHFFLTNPLSIYCVPEIVEAIQTVFPEIDSTDALFEKCISNVSSKDKIYQEFRRIIINYRPSLTRYLRVKETVTKEDIKSFRTLIDKKTIYHGEKLSEIDAGVIADPAYNKNLRLYKEFLVHSGFFSRNPFPPGSVLRRWQRELFNKAAEIFPKELLFNFMENTISSGQHLCTYIVPKEFKLPDKKDPEFIQKLFDICSCPTTSYNKKQFFKDFYYIFYYHSFKMIGVKNCDNLQRLSSVCNSEFCFPNEDSVTFLKDYLEARGEKVFTNQLCSNTDIYLNDTAKMYLKCKEGFSPEEFVARNGKSIFSLSLKEMHDELSFLSSKLRTKNVSLEKRYTKENLILNTDITLGNKTFNIRLAKDTYELIRIGQQLGICVGSAYREAAISKQCIIAAVSLDDKYTACIEINEKGNAVRQIKGWHNSYLVGDTAKAVTKWVATHKLQIETYDYKLMRPEDNCIDKEEFSYDYHDHQLDEFIA